MGLLERAGAHHHQALEALKALPIRWDRERFAFWLKQDYPFVEALYRYQVGLLAEAPQAHRFPLVQALLATVEELDWLLAQGADPKAPVHPVRREYIALLEEMGRSPTPTAWCSSTSSTAFSSRPGTPRGGGWPLAGAFPALGGPGVPGGAL